MSGGINKEYKVRNRFFTQNALTFCKVGDFVLIKDHINFAGLGAKNPLAGMNDPR